MGLSPFATDDELMSGSKPRGHSFIEALHPRGAPVGGDVAITLSGDDQPGHRRPSHDHEGRSPRYLLPLCHDGLFVQLVVRGTQMTALQAILDRMAESLRGAL